MENLNSTLNTTAYIIYLVLVLGLTVMVSQILFRNSITFMKSIFRDRDNLAIATNKLFQLGFFLLSFGIGLWYMVIYQNVETSRVLLETLSTKVGFFTLFLGVLVFFNMYLFFRGMKASKAKTMQVEEVK